MEYDSDRLSSEFEKFIRYQLSPILTIQEMNAVCGEIRAGFLIVSKDDPTIAVTLVSQALSERDCYASALTRIASGNDNPKGIAQAALRLVPRWALTTTYSRQLKKFDGRLQELLAENEQLKKDLIRAKKKKFLGVF